jgi:hypothetical protein
MFFYKCKPMKEGCYAHYISAPLDPELLFGNSQLGNHMRIRQELATPSKRKPIPTAAQHSDFPPAQPQPVPQAGPSGVAPTAPVQVANPVQPAIHVPNAGLLDAALPVTVMVWLEVGFCFVFSATSC